LPIAGQKNVQICTGIHQRKTVQKRVVMKFFKQENFIIFNKSNFIKFLLKLYSDDYSGHGTPKLGSSGFDLKN
jgi:hypothetical protein